MYLSGNFTQSYSVLSNPSMRPLNSQWECGRIDLFAISSEVNPWFLNVRMETD